MQTPPEERMHSIGDLREGVYAVPCVCYTRSARQWPDVLPYATGTSTSVMQFPNSGVFSTLIAMTDQFTPKSVSAFSSRVGAEKGFRALIMQIW
jgi:hypothetical protein